MTKSLTAMLLILAATTASAGVPTITDGAPAIANVEVVAPTHRRARANGGTALQADLTDGAQPRRPRAGTTTILVSDVPSQPRRARANAVLADKSGTLIVVGLAVE